jgi:hypothetical protein
MSIKSPSQPLLALAVPLSRFTSRVGGGSVFASLRRDGSAFYVGSIHTL